MSSGDYQRAERVTSRKHPLAIVQNIESDEENTETNPDPLSPATTRNDSNSDGQGSESDVRISYTALTSTLPDKDLVCCRVETEALLSTLEDPDVVSSMTLPDLDLVLEALEEYHAVINAMCHTDRDSNAVVRKISLPIPIVNGKPAEATKVRNPPINEQAMKESICRNFEMTEDWAAESVLTENITENSPAKGVAAMKPVIPRRTIKELIDTKRNQVLTEENTLSINCIMGENSSEAHMLKGVTSQILGGVAVSGKISSTLEKSSPPEISKNITILSAKESHPSIRPAGGFRDYLRSSLATTLQKAQGIVKGMADAIR